MHSYFSRHEVDKQGQGFSPGEEGYPSAGRIAWALWGGDPGQSWARKKAAQIDREEDKAISAEMRSALEKKAKDHNEKVGDVKSKRTSTRTLISVFNRGVGAYNTNPQSVRPNVTSHLETEGLEVESMIKTYFQKDIQCPQRVWRNL